MLKLVQVALVFLTATTFVLFLAKGAEATVDCGATINGVSTTRLSTSGNAIDVDKGGDVTLSFAATRDPGAVRVEIESGPFGKTIIVSRDRAVRPGTSWSGTVDVDDYAHFGIGLYHVGVSTANGCTAGAWINITGASPVSTPAGGVATVTAVIGVLSQLFGLVKTALGSRGGIWWALLGGVAVGLGACVLAQQAGVTPITPQWVGTWTAPPVAIGGLLQSTVASLFGRRGGESVRTSGPVSTPNAPSTAPPPPEVARPEEVAPPPPAGGGTANAGSSGTVMTPHEAGPGTTPVAPHDAVPGTTPVAPRDAAPGTTPVVRGRPDFDEAVGGTGAASPESARGTASGAAAVTEARDPPRTAFALIQCPEAVVAGEEFETRIGLSVEAVPGVSGGPLVRPPSSQGPYVLTVQVVADGFALRPGESWRHEMAVTSEAPYPSIELHLTAEAQEEPVHARAIQAIYSVGGQAMGFGVRPVAVARGRDLLAQAPPAPISTGITMAVPTDEPAADLTVRIQRGHSESGGRLIWTFDTPHAGIDFPDEAVVTDIGSEPDRFARQLVDGVGAKEGLPGLYPYLLGLGVTIADQMPDAFWDALKDVAKVARGEDRAPTVFILSEEPYVPWELAAVQPSIDGDPETPPFLGAQARVGRWVLGSRRPTLPPPFKVEVAAIAVIAGEYTQPGWNRLFEAEEEAATIVSAYQGVKVNAVTNDVLGCLRGMPAAQVLHFAVHGVYDPNSVMNGLVLTDGLTLDPLQVKGSLLSSSPLVFLNACQVGSANRVLGDYGGMAEAFLYAGASAVIAPLWSIKDTVAREIALRFYEETFAGAAPAEVLRRERATFRAAADPTSATCLSYLWYGHPNFQLRRPERRSQDAGTA